MQDLHSFPLRTTVSLEKCQTKQQYMTDVSG